MSPKYHILRAAMHLLDTLSTVAWTVTTWAQDSSDKAGAAAGREGHAALDRAETLALQDKVRLQQAATVAFLREQEAHALYKARVEDLAKLRRQVDEDCRLW